jgi:vesicle-associated membrane protein 7
VSGQYLYFCIAKTTAQQRICWAFIDEIENHLLHTGGNVKDLRSYIVTKLDYYNDPNNDKIGALKKKVDDVKDVMIDNIDKVLQRGDELDNLIQQTDTLAQDSYVYRGKSRELKNQMLKKWIILGIVLFLIVLAVIVILVFIGCNFPSFSRCRKTKKT